MATTEGQVKSTMDEKTIGASYVDTLDENPSDVVQIATEADTSNDSPWTLSMFRLYGVLSVAYLCGCLNGFDGSLMGAVNAMTQYVELCSQKRCVANIIPRYQHYFGM